MNQDSTAAVQLDLQRTCADGSAPNTTTQTWPGTYSVEGQTVTLTSALGGLLWENPAVLEHGIEFTMRHEEDTWSHRFEFARR